MTLMIAYSDADNITQMRYRQKGEQP